MEQLIIFLPLLMWVAAAIISWWMVHRYLIQPLRRLQRASTSGSGESRPGRTVSESPPPIALRSASTSSGGQVWWSNQISRPR